MHSGHVLAGPYILYEIDGLYSKQTRLAVSHIDLLAKKKCNFSEGWVIKEEDWLIHCKPLHGKT